MGKKDTKCQVDREGTEVFLAIESGITVTMTAISAKTLSEMLAAASTEQNHSETQVLRVEVQK
jgi:hypothetical protein